MRWVGGNRKGRLSSEGKDRQMKLGFHSNMKMPAGVQKLRGGKSEDDEMEAVWLL